MIRRAGVTDQPWMVALASDAYAQLGDYGSILPGWLSHAGVMPYLDECGTDRRGFILLGFYAPADAPDGAFVADLLAIAVDARFRRQGIGSALLAYAIELAEIAARSNFVPEMRLTVAETNRAGQSLFAASGFEVLDSEHGNYDGGQRAIRMRRTVVGTRRLRRRA